MNLIKKIIEFFEYGSVLPNWMNKPLSEWCEGEINYFNEHFLGKYYHGITFGYNPNDGNYSYSVYSEINDNSIARLINVQYFEDYSLAKKEQIDRISKDICLFLNKNFNKKII